MRLQFQVAHHCHRVLRVRHKAVSPSKLISPGHCGEWRRVSPGRGAVGGDVRQHRVHGGVSVGGAASAPAPASPAGELEVRVVSGHLHDNVGDQQKTSVTLVLKYEIVGISNLKAISRLTRTHGPELERKSNHFDVLTSLTCQQGLATPLIFVDVKVDII